MQEVMEYKQFRFPFPPKEKEKALKYWKYIGDIKLVCNRYHVTERTLYRWKKIYNGTLKSLENKSHRPHSEHPKAHTQAEKNAIKKLVRRNPNMGLNELYGKLRIKYGYTRHPVSLFRFLRKNGYFKDKKKHAKYKPKPYDTPTSIGEKFQLDVKFVPNECKSSLLPLDKRFYQYTIIDEATRERFIYPYDEQNAMNTCDFVIRAINYFGYKPKIIQTDNGQEFTYLTKLKNDLIHPLDQLCNKLNIVHKRIRPRTPRHNGKVERSHRNDNERFYRWLKFYSLDDLRQQMKAYLIRSNNIPISVLGWKTPLEKRRELLNEKKMKKLLKSH